MNTVPSNQMNISMVKKLDRSINDDQYVSIARAQNNPKNAGEIRQLYNFLRQSVNGMRIGEKDAKAIQAQLKKASADGKIDANEMESIKNNLKSAEAGTKLSEPIPGQINKPAINKDVKHTSSETTENAQKNFEQAEYNYNSASNMKKVAQEKIDEYKEDNPNAKGVPYKLTKDLTVATLKLEKAKGELEAAKSLRDETVNNPISDTTSTKKGANLDKEIVKEQQTVIETLKKTRKILLEKAEGAQKDFEQAEYNYNSASNMKKVAQEKIDEYKEDNPSAKGVPYDLTRDLTVATLKLEKAKGELEAAKSLRDRAVKNLPDADKAQFSSINDANKNINDAEEELDVAGTELNQENNNSLELHYEKKETISKQIKSLEQTLVALKEHFPNAEFKDLNARLSELKEEQELLRG